MTTSVPITRCLTQPIPKIRPQCEVEIIQANDLVKTKAFWNKLWERSGISWATARAEQVSNWLETFGNGRSFCTIVVREGNDWIIALPLIDSAARPGGKIADICANEWQSFCGELLADMQRCESRHWDKLVGILRKLKWNALWLEQVRLEEKHWEAFHAALKRNGWWTRQRPSHQYGFTKTTGDWASYEASRPERDSRKRRAKQLAKLGDVQLTLHHPIAAEDARRLTLEAIAVEHASWKGQEGTSIQAAGMADHYCRIAVDLARQSQLELAFLRVNGRPIAAMFSCLSHGVCHNFKIGFDEEFKKYSPGQLLIQEHLKQAFLTGSYSGVDDVGPVQPYTAIWNTDTYTVGQLVAFRPGAAAMVQMVKEKLRTLFRKAVRSTSIW